MDTEARARSHSPRTDEEIMAVVEDAINTTKDSGQLDDTDLTLKTYKIIKNSFFTHSSSLSPTDQVSSSQIRDPAYLDGRRANILNP